jgi:hypothetical protein
VGRGGLLLVGDCQMAALQHPSTGGAALTGASWVSLSQCISGGMQSGSA